MDLLETYRQEDEERKRFDSQWGLGEYSGTKCPNCGRYRLCICPNGKHRCEKCEWVPEENRYVMEVI